jgi:hypothetical protein
MAEETKAAPEEASTGLVSDITAEAETKEEDIAAEDTTVEHRADAETKPKDADAEAEERPDYIPEKFWKDGKADTESLAKGYAELEGKMRAGKHKAPEDGKYDTKFMEDKIPDDDPMLAQFNKMAVEKGLSQGDYEDLVNMVLQNGANAEQQITFDRDAELKTLGPNAEKIIEEQVDWARKLVKSEYWGVDDFEEFKIMAGTAGGIKAIMAMRRFYGDTTTIPTNISPVEDALPSKEECYAMVNDPKYQTDAGYRKKVEETFAKVFGTEPDQRVVM